MEIRFTKEVQNHLTGNSLRRPGETMDLRDDYAAGLISMDVAVGINAPKKIAQPIAQPIAPVPPVNVDWCEVDGVDEEICRALWAAGFTTGESVRRANLRELLAVSGIGPVRAKKIIDHVKGME